MFDEWQMYPVVWDSIRTDVDHTGLKGQYILTGSAKPNEGATMHTGTGRISRVLMRPMSLYESGESTGEVSLNDLFLGKDISGVSKLSLENLASIIVRGGWPASIGIDGDIKYRFAKEYVKSLIHEDVRKIDGIGRNPEKMQNLLRSLARNITTQVSNSTIEGDIKNSFADDISRPTLIDYLNTLEKLFVIEDVTAILDMKPNDLINDLNTFGFMFESLCIRDLKIYMQSYDGNISFYRDEKDFEVDAIIRTNNGMWALLKLS